MHDGYWYIGTPYTKYEEGLEAAFRHACQATAKLVEWGFTAYCPIAHTHPIAIHGGINPKSHDIWMRFDAPMMGNAKGLLVVMMPGWEDSFGLSEEIKYFLEAGKPIEFCPWTAFGIMPPKANEELLDAYK